MPAETYASTAYGAVRRIRTPHDHDVLSGRGGGINSHVGNQVFRQWVADRKEEYNLAPNKHEKTRVAEEVMDRVRNQTPPGRFLTRDPSAVTGPAWWIEVDETRALAKTSQALREGAPQIRQAHKSEISQKRATATASSTKKKHNTSTTASGSSNNNNKRKRGSTTNTAPAVPHSRPLSIRRLPSDEYNQAMEKLQANVREAKKLADQTQRRQQEQEQQAEQQQYWEPNSKRVRLDENLPHVSPGTDRHSEGINLLDGFTETPPLLSTTPSSSAERMDPLSLDGTSQHKPKDAFMQSVNSPAPSTLRSLPRVHSLAFSDISTYDNNVFDEDGEFINPFDDESMIANKVLRSRQTSNGNNGSNGNSRRRLSSEYLRNLSSSNDESGVSSEPGLDRVWKEEQQTRYVPWMF